MTASGVEVSTIGHAGAYGVVDLRPAELRRFHQRAGALGRELGLTAETFTDLRLQHTAVVATAHRDGVTRGPGDGVLTDWDLVVRDLHERAGLPGRWG